MSTAKLEFDFFAMEKHSNAASNSRCRNLFHRRSFKEIQSAISKIRPEILKSVIASGSVEHRAADTVNRIAPKPVPTGDDRLFQSLPVHSPTSRMSSENRSDTAPLTIFYNDKVAVFHVSRDEAESILQLAEKGSTMSKCEVEKRRQMAAIPPNELQQLMDNAAEDLPIARKRSLQRFMEKRKTRLIPQWPYICGIQHWEGQDKI